MTSELFEGLNLAFEKVKSLHGKTNILDEISEENLTNLGNHLQELQVHAFSIRSRLYKLGTKKYPQNPWNWYYYSCFLLYETSDKERAFDCALRSVELLTKQNELIGAISRNFIVQAMERQDFLLTQAEIMRIYNIDPESTILAGIAQDLKDHDSKNGIGSQALSILKI